MDNPRFLFDENVSRILSKALQAQVAAIDLVCVGEAGGPPKRTLDPELLEIAETDKRLLVTMIATRCRSMFLSIWPKDGIRGDCSY